MIGVLFVCLGNICRSPIAEEVFREVVRKNQKDKAFKIDSCGTADYHIGEKPDPRAIQTAFSHGLILTHRGRQFALEDFTTFAYIIVMDQNNQASLFAKAKTPAHKNQIHLFRKFDSLGDKTLDVPDPYYGDLAGFEEVYQIANRCSENLFQYIINEYPF